LRVREHAKTSGKIEGFGATALQRTQKHREK
jgi:hypothetical protein